MSNAVSALEGASYQGFAQVREMGLQGMITLRGDFDNAIFKKTLKLISGCNVPALRELNHSKSGTVVWMSPDELLVLCAYDKAQVVTDKAVKQFAKTHSMAVNVSDARAVFTITGNGAREVIAKLAPVDMAAFKKNEIRRTRLAQVPAAFWVSDDDQITIVVFRSVAQYVFDLLKTAAAKGGEVGFIY